MKNEQDRQKTPQQLLGEKIARILDKPDARCTCIEPRRSASAYVGRQLRLLGEAVRRAALTTLDD